MTFFVRVAVNAPIDRTFDYHSCQPLAVGQCVMVPFGARQVWGVVVAEDVAAVAGVAYRDVSRVLPMAPIPERTRHLISFAARYYHYPLGAAFFSVLPRAFVRLRKMTIPVLYEWVGNPLAEQRFLQQKQVAMLVEQLRQGPLLYAYDIRGQKNAAILQTLVAHGYARYATRETTSQATTIAPIALNAQQQNIVQQILSVRHFFVSVLHGATGSGKTHVYMALMAHALQQKKQILCLVPEITLVPAFVDTLQAHFVGYRIVVLHSVLADQDRVCHWQMAALGFADIVVGTRLSVFTPLPFLGLIIVDEEHETSFKQEDHLRYHARDLAIFVAKQEQIGIVLGSATPSSETIHHVEQGKFLYHALPQRACVAPAPLTIQVVKTKHFVSIPLQQAIQACLTRGEQALIFLNRRGYSPKVLCSLCQWVAHCQHCSVHLVFHKKKKKLICHHCGYTTTVVLHCPQCGNQDVTISGVGTQRIEDVLVEQFPQARIVRIDRDTMSQKDAFVTIKKEIDAQAVDILVGTQILAKGHNFKNLTLVGLIGLDEALMASKLRGEERALMLLHQLCGRVGRFEKPGQVIIQTAMPQHRFFQYQHASQYADFMHLLLAERRACFLPPYSHQAVLIAESLREERVFVFLQRLKSQLITQLPAAVTCYDPVSLTIVKKADYYRAQMLLESAQRALLHSVLNVLTTMILQRASSGVRWFIDVDPVEMS